MAVLNDILGALKTGLSGITTDNSYNTDVVSVYDYPVSFTNLKSTAYPCLSVFVDGETIVAVRDSAGRRLQTRLRIDGYIMTARSSVQSSVLALASDIKNYIDGVTASNLSSACLHIVWLDEDSEILEDRARVTISVNVTYYVAKGSN